MLVVLIALIGVMAFAPSALAEPPKAGKFFREGMRGMYEIGMLIPLERAGTMKMLGCRVSSTRATCRLAIRIQGYKPCRVRLNLTRRQVHYPLGSWHCPSAWRPDIRPVRLDLQTARQQKALD